MDKNGTPNFSGKILIASPYALYGNMFYKSIVYLLLHSKQGSVGLIINHVVKSLPISLLLKTLEQDDSSNSLVLPIHLGGPMELERVFFLHSADYDKNLLFKFPDNLAISSNLEIIKDIAQGVGPKNSLFMLGYSGWEAGQLEQEIDNNLWIVSDYNEELLFSDSNDKKWNIALKNLGIEDYLFTSRSGHC